MNLVPNYSSGPRNALLFSSCFTRPLENPWTSPWENKVWFWFFHQYAPISNFPVSIQRILPLALPTDSSWLIALPLKNSKAAKQTLVSAATRSFWMHEVESRRIRNRYNWRHVHGRETAALFPCGFSGWRHQRCYCQDARGTHRPDQTSASNARRSPRRFIW